jgi:hypothetical protein
LAEQVLPVVVRVTPVMVFAVGFVLNVRLAPQASLAMRLANPAAIYIVISNATSTSKDK